MFLRSFRQIVFAGFLVWILSAGMGYFSYQGFNWKPDFKKLFVNNSGTNQIEPTGQVPVGTSVKEEIFYQKCRHLVARYVFSSETSIGLSEQVLEQHYTRAEGWSRNQTGNEIVFYREVDDICPEDSEKRHLGALGENVAIYAGPIGVDGPLIERLNIRIDRLPLEWQEKVIKGELDFSSEKELLEALDSIDEYE